MLHSLDLFSGYGGIALALKEYSKPIAYCEIEPYARAILASRIESGDLPIAPILPDIRKLHGQIGSADIITGGFPCQDISIAGNGKGLEGERSGLFYEIVRLTKEIRPSFVFLENVPAIRTRGLEQVIKAFAEIRYDCRWTCLSASSLGAPHRRERWFLLAHADCHNLWDESGWRFREGRKKKVQSGNDGKTWTIADPESFRLSEKQRAQGVKKKRSMSASRNWWEAEPTVCGVDDGTLFRVDRVKSLGNGVVPIQVQTAFETLMGLK